MREYLSSVSPKGQITLPTELRRRLHIKPKDKVAISMEGDILAVRPVQSGLDVIYRSIPALPRQYTDSEMTEIAAVEHAQAAATIAEVRPAPKRRRGAGSNRRSRVFTMDDPLWDIVGIARGAGSENVSGNVDAYLAEAHLDEHP